MSKTWGEIREEALRRCGQLPPKTHYDQVKAMSLEELAEWIGDKDTCPPGECTHMYDGVDCPECWRDWLKEEASDAL